MLLLYYILHVINLWLLFIPQDFKSIYLFKFNQMDFQQLLIKWVLLRLLIKKFIQKTFYFRLTLKQLITFHLIKLQAHNQNLFMFDYLNFFCYFLCKTYLLLHSKYQSSILCFINQVVSFYFSSLMHVNLLRILMLYLLLN
jgi:hypothetical protein